MAKRTSKQTHRRNKPGIQPERPANEDPLYESVIEFVAENSSLALDDEYDRRTLADNLVAFLRKIEPVCDECGRPFAPGSCCGECFHAESVSTKL